MKRTKYIRILQILQILAFNVFIFGVMILSLPGVFTKSIEVIRGAELNNMSETLNNVADDYKENIVYKEEFQDIASACDLVFQRVFADNYQYLKDENGFIHPIRSDIKEPELPGDIVALRNENLAADVEIPVIYIQNPMRVDMDSNFNLRDFNTTDEMAQRSYEILSPAAIDWLEIPQEKVTYFKSDMHADTESQVESMYVLVNYLEETYGITFENKELMNVYDTNLFTKTSYPLVGGYCRSIGKYFAGMDTFNLYIPNYKTDFSVKSYDDGIVRNGGFEVLARIPDEIDDYTYWITVMGYYGYSMYKITNNGNPDGPKLAVVMDSSNLSGVCYLSLICSEVLVYDPRWSQDTRFSNRLKECVSEYDALVIDTIDNCLDSCSIYEPAVLPEQMISEYDRPVIYNVDEFGGFPIKDGCKFLVDESKDFIYMKGWAYDSVRCCGFDYMLLKIGDRMIRCNYGLDTVGKLGNSALDHTGFEVWIPMEMFQEEGTIELIGVGEDGTWYYPPLEFDYLKW